jgi:hypothetical protein
MRRPLLLSFIAISSAVLTLTGAAYADGFTTRIETRPYYGAVTTIEHGVRVMRPLPPERYVIINPNGTPLSLSISESNVYGYGSSTAIANARGGRSGVGAYNEDGPIYSYPAYGRRFFRGGMGRPFKGRPGMFPGGHGGHGGPRGHGAPGAIGAH